MEYDTHRRDLSGPLKLTLGHHPDCFSQAFPFSKVDIPMCHAGERQISRSLQGLIHGSGKPVEGPLWTLTRFELGVRSRWLLEMMVLGSESTRGPGLGGGNSFLSHSRGAGVSCGGRRLCGESLCRDSDSPIDSAVCGRIHHFLK